MSGTKVTTDPESVKNPIKESAGIVLSDSLAGESLKSGGDFGSTTGAAAAPQKSSGTTTNTTDTSNATVLPPAVDAEARRAQESWSETAEFNAGRGAPDKNAVFGARNIGSGGPGSGASAEAEALKERLQKPKGNNVTEGGFDNSAPNASYNTAIGTKKDPGRVALQGLQKRDARQPGSVGNTDRVISNDGQYDVLEDASA